MSSVTLLLPERHCLLGTLRGDAVVRALARADRITGVVGSVLNWAVTLNLFLRPGQWPP